MSKHEAGALGGGSRRCRVAVAFGSGCQLVPGGRPTPSGQFHPRSGGGNLWRPLSPGPAPGKSTWTFVGAVLPPTRDVPPAPALCCGLPAAGSREMQTRQPPAHGPGGLFGQECPRVQPGPGLRGPDCPR